MINSAFANNGVKINIRFATIIPVHSIPELGGRFFPWTLLQFCICLKRTLNDLRNGALLLLGQLVRQTPRTRRPDR